MEPRILLVFLLAQIEIREVADLVRPLVERRTAVFGSHLATSDEERGLAEAFRESFLGSAEPLPLVSRGALEEVVRRAVRPGNASFEFLDDRLVVRAAPPEQESVRSALSELVLGLSPIQIEVSIVEPPPGFSSSGPILSPEEAKAIAAGTLLARGTLAVHPGSTGSIARRVERGIVLDYDVEVAQRASIADPRLARVITGYGLDVRAHPLADRRVHLSVIADRASPVEFREVATEASRVGSIEIPRIATHAVASTIVVADGETAVVGADGSPDGAGFYVCLRPHLPPAPPPGGIQCLTIGLLADPGGRLPLSVGDRLELLSPEGEGAFPATLSAARFLEWFRESLGAPEYEEAFGRDGLAVAASPGLVVTAGVPAEATARADAFRRSLEAGAARSAGLLVEVLDPSGDPSRRATLSLTQGRAAAAAIGTETTKIADYSVEIAQRSSIADPIVEPEFGGLLVLATALSIEPERVLLDLDFRWRSLGAERRIPPTAVDVGVLTEIPVARTAFRRRVSLEPGEVLDLGPVSFADESRAAGVARIRLVPRP